MPAEPRTYWHDDPATHPPVGTWMWHVHHEELVEPLIEPLSNRLDFIREFKPEHEIHTRLSLIDIVKGEVPPELVKAGAAYVKVWAAYDEAEAAYDEAEAAHDKALIAAQPALEALHATEHPDCPWDGQTIFPEAHDDR